MKNNNELTIELIPEEKLEGLLKWNIYILIYWTIDLLIFKLPFNFKFKYMIYYQWFLNNTDAKKKFQHFFIHVYSIEAQSLNVYIYTTLK